MARLAALRDQIRESLWLMPVIGLILAMGLTIVTIEIDSEVTVGSSTVIGFDGGPDSARSILSTIAASMLTFLALVFTLTVVALQLATNFSPRLLSSFLTARISKISLAVFVATFTYSVLVLREVNPESVPELSVSVAIVLVIISVIVFVYYLSAIAQSVRVATIVERAAAATRGEIESSFEEGEPGEERRKRKEGWRPTKEREPDRVFDWPGTPGVVTSIDLDGLRGLAERLEAVIELRLQVGDFVPAGAPALAAYGYDGEIDAGTLQRGIATAKERTLHQDAAFGLRQLADIASRALSPGVNDPTTAVQALDQIHDLLLRLGGRCLYSGVLRDANGEVRLLVPVHTWEDYLHLAIDETRLYGADSLQICRRLRALLEDLADRLPEARIPAVREQLELLDASVEASFNSQPDRDRARLTTTAAGGAEGGD